LCVFVDWGDTLKRKPTFMGQKALKGVTASVLCLAMSSSWAMGLGKLSVQSALGEPLRAEIDITSMANEESSNLKVRVAPPDSYRAAGVEYNAVLPSTQVTLLRRANGQPYLKVVSNKSVQEPFVDVILEISWPTGRLVREYTMLFDPSNSAQASKSAEPEPMVAPVITAAATEKPSSSRRPVQQAEPPIPEDQPAAPPKPPKAPKAAPKPPAERPQREAPVNATEYRVRTGDSLSRIAARMQRSGVSLDQMLVSLYRSNPQAFIGENMNRLKAGVVLAVPSAADAKSVTNAEARQIIHAQSSNFGSYRRRLAEAVPAATVPAGGRQAGGKVEAKVDDRNKASTDAAPDKLTLSKGSASAVKGVEDQASKEKAAKDASTRVAELSKSVAELKKLNEVASAAKQTAPAASVAQPVVVPPPVVKPPPVVASEPASSSMSVVPTVPPVVATPQEVASAPPEVLASAPKPPPPVASEPESAIEPAAASAVEIAKKPTEPAAPAGPGFLDANPWVLPVGGGLLALLGGFGAYRLTRRARKDSGETSFLESRLQPDSFFGASGGQRIDTRDASGQSSSMSYSLSQLDAIGDVDPVAEADVYLAYGRDLQAEEILKEAMRSTPDRMAIRTKLLEVYAKRRDVKGFELLAAQLYSLTNGQGEDWAKTQEMGAQIDADNPMYLPGGRPAAPVTDRRSELDKEPLGASTMPLSILPTAPKEDYLPTATVGGDSLLDLDLDLGGASPAPASALAARSKQPDLSFDLDIPDTTPSPGPGPAISRDALSTDLDLELDAEIDVTSPLARKLELAEEFRQIGDNAGARDLLQEVVTKSSGRLKEKAQSILDKLR
jgi:pilus assembly protein FimV